MREIKTKATRRGNIISPPQSHQNIVAGFNKVASQVSKISAAIPLKKERSFAFNRSAAIVGLVLLSPVFILAATHTSLTLKGSVIFPQTRRGKNGDKFTLYKLKTMRDLKPEEKAYDTDNQRLTKWGAFYRITHIDEYPQLWNILKGDMNFIGVRPQPYNFDEYETPDAYKELDQYPRGWISPKLLAEPHIARSTPDQDDFFQNYAEGCRIELKYMKNRTWYSDVALVAKVGTKIALDITKKIFLNKNIEAANPDKDNSATTSNDKYLKQPTNILTKDMNNVVFLLHSDFIPQTKQDSVIKRTSIKRTTDDLPFAKAINPSNQNTHTSPSPTYGSHDHQ